jgi:hypothetical protein
MNGPILLITISNPQRQSWFASDSFKLQTMTALIKSFCRGSRGAVFSKSAPLAAGGKLFQLRVFFMKIFGVLEGFC